MQQSSMIRFKSGEIILKQGSVVNEMYKLISGKAEVYLNYGQEDEYLVGILSEQRCFGELSLLCNKANVYTVIAYGETLVFRITQENFAGFITQNPQNAMDIMKNLANTIATLSANLNMISDDIVSVVNAKSKEISAEDITERIKRYASLSGLSKNLIS